MEVADSSSNSSNGMNREQMKKMSEADKEMELRANRAKALLAERHIGLKTNQVRVSSRRIITVVMSLLLFIAVGLIGGYHPISCCGISLTPLLTHVLMYIIIHKYIDYIHINYW
jgi:hypothetical protein